MKLIRRSVLAAGLLLMASATFAQAPQVSAAWARPTVEGQRGGGGFLTITGGAAADKLLGASAEVSKVVELHSMSMDGHVMKMRAVSAIDVPAGATVKLEPGGLHLMFIDLKAPLQNGKSFPLTLKFEKAGEMTVQVAVRPRP
jgi:periplasmic copper chaperone A